MLLLGIDLGTSSIKVSVVDGATGRCITSAHYPETEAAISTPQKDWAEQSPEQWWEHTILAIRKANSTGLYNPAGIGAIGIAYQMHGLVIINKKHEVLRPAIIWCDSRAVTVGEKAFRHLGDEYCLNHLLNAPGNFTASKLAWVKEHEPNIFKEIYQFMLPGDFLAMKLTGNVSTTPSALSEGILWDFPRNEISKRVMDYFGFEQSLVPTPQPVFSSHGTVNQSAAELTGLRTGIPVSYKAGDQLNNAFSLNVLRPGEVAATAGTSGVIYGVSDTLSSDPLSRINSFAHLNHTKNEPRVGVLLCINGCGIANRWLKNQLGDEYTYEIMNQQAANVPAGADDLVALPFGNGVERMFCNTTPGAGFKNLDFNCHGQGHLVRATQEGIAFSFRYGLDIMRENGINPSIIRAGRANMFLSPVFRQAFVDATGVAVELYNTDGSIGTALGAGLGAGFFKKPGEAFRKQEILATIEPHNTELYETLYQAWKSHLPETH